MAIAYSFGWLTYLIEQTFGVRLPQDIFGGKTSMTTQELRDEAARYLDSGQGAYARLLNLVADAIDGEIARVKQADATESGGTSVSSSESGVSV